MWFAATHHRFSPHSTAHSRTHATPLLLAPLGKNINTNNALHYYTCSGACCGELALHHEALGDQEGEKSKESEKIITAVLHSN